MDARDFLRKWLSVGRKHAGATERTFYPHLARFLSGLLGFPEKQIRQADVVVDSDGSLPDLSKQEGE